MFEQARHSSTAHAFVLRYATRVLLVLGVAFLPNHVNPTQRPWPLSSSVSVSEVFKPWADVERLDVQANAMFINEQPKPVQPHLGTAPPKSTCI